MSIQLIAATVQYLLFLAYVLYIVYRFGVLPSISESTYRLSTKEKGIFFIWLVLLGFLNLAQPLGIYGVVAMVGLGFTGVSVNHKQSLTRKVHTPAAFIAIGSSFSGLLMLHGFWIPLVVFLSCTSLTYFKTKEQLVWWVEIVALHLIIGSYFFL